MTPSPFQRPVDLGGYTINWDSSTMKHHSRGPPFNKLADILAARLSLS